MSDEKLIILSHYEELVVTWFILILLWWKMCYMFPCVMEKPAFATRDAPIDKRNLFLLSWWAISRCKHKSLKEKLSIFYCQLSSNSCYFSLFHFLLWILFFLLQISSSLTLTYFFFICVKPTPNVIIKNEKKSVARNTVASKKISFSDLC